MWYEMYLRLYWPKYDHWFQYEGCVRSIFFIVQRGWTVGDFIVGRLVHNSWDSPNFFSALSMKIWVYWVNSVLYTIKLSAVLFSCAVLNLHSNWIGESELIFTNLSLPSGRAGGGGCKNANCLLYCRKTWHWSSALYLSLPLANWSKFCSRNFGANSARTYFKHMRKPSMKSLRKKGG